jgi:hypothetical protein
VAQKLHYVSEWSRHVARKPINKQDGGGVTTASCTFAGHGIRGRKEATGIDQVREVVWGRRGGGGYGISSFLELCGQPMCYRFKEASAGCADLPFDPLSVADSSSESCLLPGPSIPFLPLLTNACTATKGKEK